MAMGQGTVDLPCSNVLELQRRHCQEVFAALLNCQNVNPTNLHLQGHAMLWSAFPAWLISPWPKQFLRVLRHQRGLTVAPGAKKERRGCGSPSVAAGQPSWYWILFMFLFS